MKSFFTLRPLLSEFVDFFWIYEGYAASHQRELVMPTPTLDVVFTLIPVAARSPVYLARARRHFLLDTSLPFSAIGIHFGPGGGFPFFGVSAGELHNQTVSLDTLWRAFAGTVGDQLWEARTPEARFLILERALLARARSQRGLTPSELCDLTTAHNSEQRDRCTHSSGFRRRVSARGFARGIRSGHIR